MSAFSATHRQFIYTAVCVDCTEIITVTSQDELRLRVKEHRKSLEPSIHLSAIWKATYVGSRKCERCRILPALGEDWRFVNGKPMHDDCATAFIEEKRIEKAGR